MKALNGLACAQSLSYLWNLGSFLGLTLVFQLLSGVLLVLNYSAYEPYISIINLVYDVNLGWLLKLFHSNNASLIFALLYLHLFKNLLMGSYRLHYTWNSGVLIIILIIGAGFTGYVLVGSQISFWAAIVITSFVSVVPINGEMLLYFIWGGYSISWATLQLLFVFHFILPFVVLVVILIHLWFLHHSGSTSALYNYSAVEKVPFFPYYWVKDTLNVGVYLIVFVLILLYPYSLGEPELCIEANPLNSPLHITPEWYFLLSYALLRCVPNKSLGLVFILLGLLVYFLYPFMVSWVSPPTEALKMWSFSYGFFFILLSYLGSCPLSPPYLFVASLSSITFFIIHCLLVGIWSLISIYYYIGTESNLLFYEEGKVLCETSLLSLKVGNESCYSSSYFTLWVWSYLVI